MTSTPAERGAGPAPARPAAAEPVAIVGMAVLLPGAVDLAAYWRNLAAGVDAISAVPADRWDDSFHAADLGAPDSDAAGPDRFYCRRGGFVTDLSTVDPVRSGVMPASLPGTEPDQLIALAVAAAALADAGGADRLGDRDRVGVILGRGGYLTPALSRMDQRVRTANQLVRTLAELIPELPPARLAAVKEAFTDRLGPYEPAAAIGVVPNLAASRIANRLDLGGPAYTVDAACASSLLAVDHAVAELGSGRCDAVLAGGVHHCHDVTFWSVFTQLRALSRCGEIRPFDRRADGLLIGEGTGVVLLKRLSDADSAGDRVYAVIRGTGIASDGRGSSLVSPRSGGQVQALTRAWRAAGLDPTAPGSVGLLEGHGTATPTGDAAELDTLAAVFGPPAGERAVIGSVKSMIGHTMPAAGIAGLIKAALALHHRTLLPTLHCEQPHPALERTRFAPIDAARPWDVPPGQVRRAAVDAFGFGGINGHVILAEAPGAAPSVPAARVPAAAVPAAAVAEPEVVLRLAAPTPERLAELLTADDAALRGSGVGGSDVDGAAGGCRLAIVGPTARRLALARSVVGAGTALRGRNDVWFSPRPLLAAGGRLAFVFPGLETDPVPPPDDLLRVFGGRRPATAAGGGIGHHALAVFELGRLLDRALRELRIVPDALAGHSLGEWTAMACAGMYEPDAVDAFLAGFDPDGVDVPGLAFAALGCGADRAAGALARVPGVVLSHDNSPNQSVVCGPAAAVDQVVRLLRADGVLGQVLPFRSGFHSPMLAPYLGPIRDAADTFTLHPPALPVWSATTTAVYPTGERAVRQLFVRHLVEPVRFRQLVQALYEAGVRVFVQLGAGQLAALVSDTLRGAEHLAVPATAARRGGLDQLRRVAAAVWVEGGDPDTTRLAPPPRPATDRRPGAGLSLGSGLLSLGAGAPALVGPRTGHSALSTLDTSGPLAPYQPVIAELDALLRQTADAAADVIRAAGAAAPAPPRAGFRTTLRVSTVDMPYLVDHRVIRQRAGWPDEADRWPVVPAGTIVALAADAAARSVPGSHPVGVRAVRLRRWLVAAPARDVEITGRPAGAGSVRVELGPYATATVDLAPAYPPAPPRWRVDAPERDPGRTGPSLYTDRWMFHGPAFQGVTELTGIGDRHARAVLTVPPAPGALLDNVGQVLGYWVMAMHRQRRVVFPVAIDRITVHGPAPRPGERVGCVVWVTGVTELSVTADAQLSTRDGVWAGITGWQDRRFDSHPDTVPAERFPETATMSAPRPGGWELLWDRWPDPASRELVMRNQLGGAERDTFERQPPAERSRWLAGRIAAKDAARRLLWARGAGPIFPAELTVSGGDRIAVTGRHGRDVPALDVSVALCRRAAVAIAREHRAGAGIGIDLREVGAEPAGLPAAELAAARAAADPAAEVTRYLAARQAVAKAAGTDPGAVAVRQVDQSELVVDVPGRGAPAPNRRYRVRTELLTAPADLPPSRYVVAWTGGLSPGGQPEGVLNVSGTDAPLPWRSDVAGTQHPDATAVLDELRGMLRRILGEFGFSADDAAAVTVDTTFYGDLEMESIDLVALAGQLAERYGDAVNFAEFLAAFDLDQVIDLRVGQLVGHIVAARRRAGPGARTGLVAKTGAR